jgi:2,5-furandicarboxylate decarboxylase 1
MGIDATIPDNVPRERFHRITYAYADEVQLGDFLGPASGAGRPIQEIAIDALADEIKALIKETPLYFAELCEKFVGYGFQSVNRALGELHEAGVLWQDAEGRHCLKGSKFAAVPPKR